MIVFRIVAIALIASVLILVIKQEKPEIAFLLSLVCGLIIFILVVNQIAQVIDLLLQLSTRANINQVYLNTIFKIIGIAYIGEFGAEITRDAGESALAAKIELAVKIIIMFIALPVMVSLIETIISFLP